MGRRKNNNNNSSSSENQANDMEQHHPAKIRFRDDDDDADVEEALDAATESSNLDESMCDVDGSVAGCDKALDDLQCDPDDADDKTSADYYFDSYSHFGNYYTCFQ